MHEYRAIYETSPLNTVGILHLLIAIVQFIFAPVNGANLARLLEDDHEFWHRRKFFFRNQTVSFNEEFFFTLL
jgi:hypothetical protein